MVSKQKLKQEQKEKNMRTKSERLKDMLMVRRVGVVLIVLGFFTSWILFLAGIGTAIYATYKKRKIRLSN